MSVKTVNGDHQVGRLVVDVEACHAVYLCVNIRDEAETVFALGSARHGECLEFVGERFRKVSHAHPLVLTIHRALHNEQGVGKAHDGLQVEIKTHTATTRETTFVVAVGLSGAEHHVLAVIHRHGGREQIGSFTVAAKHAAHAWHAGRGIVARVSTGVSTGHAAASHTGEPAVSRIFGRLGLGLAVFNFPAFAKPASGELGSIVKTLVHLLGSDGLSLHADPH